MLPGSGDDYLTNGFSDDDEEFFDANDEFELTFYSVCLSDKRSGPSARECVFVNRNEALTLTKSKPGSRFKAFKSIVDALEFAAGDSHASESPSIRQVDALQRRPFPTPNQAMLNRFAKLIDTNNVKEAIGCIESNPCYLISICDTPTVLKISTRSNAAHLCAQNNAVKILTAVLNSVQNPEYVKRLYPQDNEHQINIRCDRLLDLYLNSADRMRNDLPLHIACRRGSVDVIRILIAYPGCRRDWLNNFNQTPQEVIDPAGANGHTYQEIDDALNGLFYVPIIEKEENGPGCVCEPCDSSLLMSPGQSPVRAIAGPMTIEKADKLINEFRCIRKQSLSAKKTDDDLMCNLSKGPETVLRKISKKLDVKFGESWPFLEGLVDITSPEGLRLLDLYIRQRYISDHFPHFCSVLGISDAFKLSAKFETIVDASLNGQNNLLSNVVANAIASICLCGKTARKIFTNCAGLDDSSLDELNERIVKLSLNESCSNGVGLNGSFLGGDSLSSLDKDVFKALQNATVDERYPFVRLWQSSIADILN